MKGICKQFIFFVRNIFQYSEATALLILCGIFLRLFFFFFFLFVLVVVGFFFFRVQCTCFPSFIGWNFQGNIIIFGYCIFSSHTNPELTPLKYSPPFFNLFFFCILHYEYRIKVSFCSRIVILLNGLTQTGGKSNRKSKQKIFFWLVWNENGLRSLVNMLREIYTAD